MAPGSCGRRPTKPRAKNSKAANRPSRGSGRPSRGGGRISKRRSDSFSGDRTGRPRAGGSGRSRSGGHNLSNDTNGRRVGRDRDRADKGDGEGNGNSEGVTKKRTNLKALRRERWGAEKSAAHKKSCEEGRQRKAEDDKRRAVAIARGEEPPARRHASNKRLRVKGGEKRHRILVVRGAGDPHPKARGRVPKTDLPVKTDAFDDDMFVARKARELFAPPLPPVAEGAEDDKKKKGNGNKVFDSIQEGETLEGFKQRINAEVKEAQLALAKTDNHQRMKKRAYYEKRREKAERRKRRKKGIYSDDEDGDVEDEDDGYDEGGNNNNGALTAMIDMVHERIADNQRKRKGRKRHRADKAREEEQTPWDSPSATTASIAPRFGEQAMRPPLLAFPPTVRGGKSLPNKKNVVVVSNAYNLIK